MLATSLGLPPYIEVPDANPFISRFYAAPAKWALRSQAWFLSEELRQHAEISTSIEGGVQDNSQYETVSVFARVQEEFGFLAAEELELLVRFEQACGMSLPAPDLLVHLHAPVEELMRRIADRGRPYEEDMPSEYLHRLDALDRDVFSRWSLSPVVEVDTAKIDLADDHGAQTLAAHVRTALLGAG